MRAAGERKSFSVQQFFKNAAEVWASSTLAGKSRGGTPFCRTLKIGFPKSNVSRETTGNPL
jgi:hypothetical protein